MSEERPLADPTRITFYFNDVRRSVTIEEALILQDWLYRTRSLPAGPLRERIGSEIEADDKPGIELDAGSRVVLHQLLTGTDLGEYAGLKGLAQALQGEEWNQPLEDGEPGPLES